MWVSGDGESVCGCLVMVRGEEVSGEDEGEVSGGGEGMRCLVKMSVCRCLVKVRDRRCLVMVWVW